MSSRPLVFSLITMGVLALSCDAPLSMLSTLPAADEEDRLAVTEREPSEAPAPASEFVISPALVQTHAEILADLRSRHTGLSDRELIVLTDTIVQQALLHDFDPELVMAVIRVESSGYHMAVSHVGALGLMQLLPSTGEELAGKLGHEWRGPDSLFDPILNVKLGTAYLRQLTDRYESLTTALAAYNWGPGRIDRRIRRGAGVPTRYVLQVERAYEGRLSKSARES